MKARPNLIREDVLPPDSCQYSKTFKTSLRSARDMTFTLKGVLGLHVDMGEELVSTPLAKAPVLATAMMLGMTIIDKHVHRIRTSRGFPSREEKIPRQYSLHCRKTFLATLRNNEWKTLNDLCVL